MGHHRDLFYALTAINRLRTMEPQEPADWVPLGALTEPTLPSRSAMVHLLAVWGQDWGPLTAHDVAFSFTDAGKEGSRAARAGSFNDANGRGIWNCVAVDDNTVSCDHDPSKLSPEFFYHISNENGLVSISSKNVYDTLGEEQAILTPHGSGPWEVTKQVGNDELVARAKLDHWRSPPLADSLRIIEIREPSQAAAALITGEVDLAQIPNSLVIDTPRTARVASACR